VTAVPIDSVGAFLGAPEVLEDGPSSGPLAGVTVGVKDVIDIAGKVTGAGNPTFLASHAAAARSAEAVQRLVAAGAVVVGKTISDELAYSLDGVNAHYGTPRNLAAPGRVAGGSSSGSASAVTAGLVDLGLGTDTGGSIRVPASYCGIYGWRPTHGAVPVDGVVPLAPSFDTVGLFSRHLETLRLGAAALLGDPAGVPPPEFVPHALESAWAVLTQPLHARSEVLHEPLSDARSVELGIDLIEAADAFRSIQGWEAWRCHGMWIEAHKPNLAPAIAQRFADASTITANELLSARAVAAHVRERVVELTSDAAVLVLPAAPGPAPLLTASASAAGRAATLELTCVAGLAGSPVVVVPGMTINGLPVGVAYLGAPGSDLALIDWLTSTWIKHAE
jgi:amidase